MAGKIIYMAPIENASGKIFGKKERFISVKRSFGNKQKGCAVAGTRNYVFHPLTQKETVQRGIFAEAAGIRAMILADPSLKSTWLGKFRADQATSCHTLNGYIMQNALKGRITEEGQPIG